MTDPDRRHILQLAAIVAGAATAATFIPNQRHINPSRYRLTQIYKRHLGEGDRQPL